MYKLFALALFFVFSNELVLAQEKTALVVFCIPDTTIQYISLEEKGKEIVWQKIPVRQNGYFVKELPMGKEYAFNFSFRSFSSSPDKFHYRGIYVNDENKTPTSPDYDESKITIDLTQPNQYVAKVSIVISFDCNMIDCLYFGWKKTTNTSPRNKDVLQMCHKILQDYGTSFGFYLQSHAGLTEPNPMELSLQRAENTVKDLVALGISPTLIKTTAYGNTEPTVPDYENGKLSKNNMALNRRICGGYGYLPQTFHILTFPTATEAQQAIIYGYQHRPLGNKFYIGQPEMIRHKNKVLVRLLEGFNYEFFYLQPNNEEMTWSLDLREKVDEKQLEKHIDLAK
jgi:outer membrane protein OmpA-like peptidoglycan-associated protein